MSRKDLAFVALAGLFVVTAAVIYDPGAFGPVAAFGALIVGGIIRVVFLARRRRHNPFSTLDTVPTSDRSGTDDDTPQLVGRKCVHCALKITAVFEAARCAICEKPVHTDCSKDHSVDGHREAPRVPYR